MKYLCIVLALVSLHLSQTCIANAKPLTLAWDASPEVDLAGYKIYSWQPNASAVVKDCGKVLTCTVDIEVAKAYSFAVTAYSTAGLESEFSNIVVFFEMYGTPLEIISVGPNKIARLSWLQAPPAKGYQLVYGTGSGANINWIGTNSISGFTNNVGQITLIQGTNFFKVRPVFQGLPGNPDYASDYSALASIAPPNRPTLRIVLPPEQLIP